MKNADCWVDVIVGVTWWLYEMPDASVFFVMMNEGIAVSWL